MQEIKEQSIFDGETKRLTVDGHEVGFIYYRTGYQDTHYMIS